MLERVDQEVLKWFGHGESTVKERMIEGICRGEADERLRKRLRRRLEDGIK